MATKPPVLPIWANAGDKVQPTNPELEIGWPLSSTPPSRQRFNWVLNHLANGVQYLTRRGLTDYDAAEMYMDGDCVIGDDGKTYRSLVDNNINNTPSTSGTQWERWGMTPTEVGLQNIATAGGTADAITATFSPAITALSAGMTLYVRAAAANTTTTPTFAPNGLAAKTIVKGANLALLAGDIAAHWLTLQYDAVLDKWVLQNPAFGVVPDIGTGRTRQNVSASRIKGATYYNTTDRRIYVSYTTQTGVLANCMLALYINDVPFYFSTGAANTGYWVSVGGEVYPGESYKIADFFGNSGTTGFIWNELR